MRPATSQQRILKEFESAGNIKIGYRAIEVVDARALTALATPR